MNEGDYEKTIHAVKEKFSSSDKIRMEVSIQVYNMDDLGNAVYQDKILVRKDFNSYYYSFKNSEMLLTGADLVSIQKATGEVTVQKLTGKELSLGPVHTVMDILLNLPEEHVQYRGNKGGEHHFHVARFSGTIEALDVFIDPAQKQITRIEYNYQKQFVSVAFKEI